MHSLRTGVIMGKIIIILLFLFLPLEIYPQCRAYDGTDDRTISGTTLTAWFQGNKAQFTVESWIYLDAIGENNLGVLNLEANSEIVFGVDSNNQLKSYLDGTSEAWYVSGGITLEATKWYHIAIVYNGATRTHYIDGEVDGTPLAETGSTTGRVGQFVSVGRYGADFFKGKVDEGRIWDYAKTQAQIQSNKNNVVADNEPGLRGYWQMDEEAGTLFNRSAEGSLLDLDIIVGTLTNDNAPIKRIIGE